MEDICLMTNDPCCRCVEYDCIYCMSADDYGMSGICVDISYVY